MQQQIDAIPLTPLHVCTLVVPSLSASHASTTTSVEWYNDTPKYHENRRERSPTPNSLRSEQQFGSLTSISSSATNRTNTATATASGTSTHLPSRPFSSSSTVVSSASNGSNQQQHNLTRSHPNSSSSLVSQKHTALGASGNNSIHNASPSSASVTSATASVTTTTSATPSPFHKRPGSVGSLASSANPQTSSPMKIVFQQYLVVPTMDGRMLVYQIIDYLRAQQSLLKEELHSHRHTDHGCNTVDSSSASSAATANATATKIHSLSDVEMYHARIENARAKSCRLEQSRQGVEPIYSLGPFFIGDYYVIKGDEDKNKHHLQGSNKNNSNNKTNSSSGNSHALKEQIPASIIGIDCITITKAKQQQQYVAILTNEGDVHIMRFHSLSHEYQKRQHRHQQHFHRNYDNRDELQIEHIQSFYSGNIGATCLTMCHTNRNIFTAPKNNHNEPTVSRNGTTESGHKMFQYTNYKSILQIAIGHDNGVITCFELLQSEKNGKFLSMLKWIGKFDEHFSIRSMAYIGEEKEEANGDANTKIDPKIPTSPTSPSSSPRRIRSKTNLRNQNRNDKDDSMLLCHQYLVVGMGQNDTDHLNPTIASQNEPPSSPNMAQCLEMINMSHMETEWNGKFQHMSKSSLPMISDYNTMHHSLSLDNFTVWPVREMLNDDNCFLVRTPQRKKSHHKKKRNKVKHPPAMFGVNIVDAFHNKQDHAFVASMSDGTLITMHYYKNKNQNLTQPELCWALSSTRNKIKLPQTICDLGLIHHGSNNVKENSVIACLRDGSVFAIPVTSMSPRRQNLTGTKGWRDLNIALYDLPQDSDGYKNPNINIDERVKSYTQGFTSGYVQVKDFDGNGDLGSEKGRMLLLTFHAWAGGLIDCHCCSLLPDRFPMLTETPPTKNGGNISAQRRTVWSRTLASHGVLEKLISFLLSLDLSNGVWKEDSTLFKAALECRSLGKTQGEVLDIVTSNCNDNNNLKSLESFSKLIDYLIFGTESHDIFNL